MEKISISEDGEIAAMANITKALEPLDKFARQRVLEWAAQRFGIEKKNMVAETESAPSAANHNQGTRLETFAELFEKADPSSDKDKALVAAYWFQICLDKSDFKSLPLNRELRNMGLGLSNVAETLRRCTAEKPALVLQVGKIGSKKGRKAFRLTQAGIQRVNDMIQRGQLDRDVDYGGNEISY